MTENNDTPKKRCSRCGEYFPPTREYFYADKKTPDGLYYHCKKCHNTRTSLRAVAWQRANRERTRATHKRHRDKSETKTKIREYREANRERIRELQREASMRFYNRHKRGKTVKYNKGAVRRWRTKNPAKVQMYRRSYEAKKRSLPNDFSAQQWKHCLEWWNHTCAYCGSQQSFWFVLEQEHYVPVTSQGGYTVNNIVPACVHCNTSKGNKPAEAWLLSRNAKPKTKQILDRITVYFEWVKSQA